MKLILVCAVITVAAASRDHEIVILKSENPATEYREQDSNGFYSFGYSDDESAKAEYTTQDGTSKGFYSYIDTDGKLQTVKYEAGRRQGFTASATNLPVQPVDNSEAPEPVTDTPEVEIAKLAHFDAYRDAAIKAAMEPENEGDADDIAADMDEEMMKGGGLNAAELADLQQNTRDLLLSRQNSRDQLLALLRDREAEQDSSDRGQQQLMTTYTLSANAEARAQGSGNLNVQAHTSIGPSPTDNNELRTVYRMKNGQSNVELKVGNGNGKSLSDQAAANDLTGNENENIDANGIINFHALKLLPTENIDIGNAEQTYYKVDNPSVHYSVAIPTVLTTLPRIESIRLGNGNGHRTSSAKSSTYITQRLKSSTL